MGTALSRDLAAIAGVEQVLTEPAALRPYLSDATEARGLSGSAEAVVLPNSAEAVAAVLAHCYERGVAVTPRGGGTGYAGGAVPRGGVVLSLERLGAMRSFEPLLWRGEAEAGVLTARIHRLARENGLLYPPDPSAGEQSQIGGNVATNAGGPHAFKYGVTGAWVTGVEAAVAPGELIRLGGFVRKDVAGYDLRSLLVGSEGTLGVITAVSLRFIPAPETATAVVGCFADERAGADAVLACLASGVTPAALEYLDAGATAIAAPSYPGELPAGTRFVVIAEADGTREEAERGGRELEAALREAGAEVSAWAEPAARRELWRWRDGVGVAADAALGGKVSEDIAVPVDRLGEAIAATREIGERHGLRSCSWGHAGDGNLHSSFLFDRTDPEAGTRAAAAAEDLFALAAELGGTISGEHGLGLVKGGQLDLQWGERAVDLHRRVKTLFDPKGLLNPGKKEP